MEASTLTAASLYPPLSSEDYEIRLLTLLPGDSDCSIISCTLENISLNETIEYEALSYTWGDPGVTETILVNGFAVQATTNLVAALWQLRSTEPRVLWIDAICINQADEPTAREERALQVRQMKEIYSEATSVIAWVGPEDESSRNVFDLIEEVRQDRSRLHSYRKNPNSFENHEACNVFFARPYWRRVWIVQEIAVPAILWVQCGSRKTSWENFQQILPTKKLVDFQRFRNSVLLGPPVTLLEAIYGTRTSLATQPVDKIYALLGLASDGHTIIPRPTYKRPVETVLTDMMKIILMKEKCLDLITIKQPDGSHAGMPSWVPDLTELDKAIGPGQLRHVLKFSGDKRVNFQFHENELKVRGQLSHTIDGVTSSLYEGLEVTPMTQPSQINNNKIITKYGFWELLAMRSTYDNKLRYTNAICSPEGQHLINGQFPVLAAWLKINRDFKIGKAQLGSFFEPAPPTKIYGSTLPKVASAAVKFYATPVWAAGAMTGMEKRPLTEWYKKIDTTLQEQPEFSKLGLERFLRLVEMTLEHGIKLIVTNVGVVGLAPARTQSNDRIYLIDGCSVPVVLRSQQSAWEVIGEAWFPPLPKEKDATATSKSSTAKYELILV